MSILKNQKFVGLVCPLIAALIFAFSSLFGDTSVYAYLFTRLIPSFFRNIVNFDFLYAFFSLFNLLDILSYILGPLLVALCLVIGAFSKKKLVIAPIVLILMAVFGIVSNINYTIQMLHYSDFSFINILMRMVFWVDDVVMLIMAVFCFIGRSKKPLFLKKLWFAPAILQGVFVILYAATRVFAYGFNFHTFLYIFCQILTIFAYAAMGLFFCYGEQAEKKPKVRPAPAATPVRPVQVQTKPEPVVPIRVADGNKANEIRDYKKLLDEGIITAEEFEAKKKQLLGL